MPFRHDFAATTLSRPADVPSAGGQAGEVVIVGVGTCEFAFDAIDGEQREMTVENVHYVPACLVSTATSSSTG